LVVFLIYFVHQQRERTRESEHEQRIADEKADSLRHVEEMARINLQRMNDSINARNDSINTVFAKTRQDSIDYINNEQIRVQNVALATSRIREFGETYMNKVSPTSGGGPEQLEIQIDTSRLTYDYQTKTTKAPFSVKWKAFLYGILVSEDAKSSYWFEGNYSLMGNHEEYIETTYQNSALQERINKNQKTQRVLNGLDNVADLMEKLKRIDDALSNKE